MSAFTEASAAVADVLPRLTAMLRRHQHNTAIAVGEWTLPEVACHISHVLDKDTDALCRRSLPDIELSPRSVARMTRQMLADDPERDLAVLADRIDALGAAFLQLEADPPTHPVTWVGGTQLPPEAVACHLLEELLVHGYDAARAARAPWTIAPAHAAMAIAGAAVPIMTASPASWVRPTYNPRTTRCRVEIHLRGHERFVLALEDGLHVECPPAASRADAYLSADPAGLLLVMLGRRSPWSAVVRGNFVVWGRRPQALLTFLRNTSPP